MKIMVCYDGTEESKKALELSLSYGKAFQAQMIATIALEGDPDRQLDDLERAEQILQYAKNFLVTSGLKCETKMLPANNLSVGENIVRFAQQERIDKIVLGVQKKSKVGKVFFGSTAQHVILQAPCAVIAAK